MKTEIIAEIGLGMNGEMPIAKELIKQAKLCGITHVKSQKRTIKEYLTEEQYNMPYDNPNSFGPTYGKHREFLELSTEEHIVLKQYTESLDMTYFVSCWDVTAARHMDIAGMPIFKVASACLTDDALLEEIKSFGKPIYLSTGMSTIKEIDRAIYILKGTDLTLFHTTSCYPCKFQDIHLETIPFLESRYNLSVGFSGHHLGIAIDIAAVILGATKIERHFTLDRTMKGSDHAASLEPAGLHKLVRDVKATEDSLALHNREKILDCEVSSWEKLRTV